MKCRKLTMAIATVAAVCALSIGTLAASTSVTIKASGTKGLVPGDKVTVTATIKNPKDVKDKTASITATECGRVVHTKSNAATIVCLAPGKITVTATTPSSGRKASVVLTVGARSENDRYASTLRTNTKNSVKLIDKYLNGGKACFSTFMSNCVYSVRNVSSTKLQTVQTVKVGSVTVPLKMRNFYFVSGIYNAKGLSDAWYGDVYYAAMLLYNAQQASLLQVGTASSRACMTQLITTLKKVDSGLKANSSAKKVAVAFCNYVAKYGSAADKVRANKTLPYCKKLG